ncbi:MAG TPA: primosomal protein N' [Streptosporangiaceae bacterium]|nr:primosomal protein N' [Streptosporangiaceae bacterium]
MAKGSKEQAVSVRLPVARVAVDISLAHLDRPFDYLVPASMDQTAVPGCRVRVRFAGQLVDGYLLDRTQTSEHQGRLARLERVISPEPVLTPEIFNLARAVADRYAGTLADVLRLAIPPRHATAEREAPAAPDPSAAPSQDPVPRPESGSWTRYPAGETFLGALVEGRPVRAAWSALPGPEWPAEIAIAAATTAAAGRGVVIVVPDARDLARVDTALSAVGPAGANHVCLTADLGPAERYRRWLAALRGTVKIVAGTRAAMFAPVADLGLVVLWDDGDDLHAEPRAPYPNAREVLALRAHRSGAAALIGGFARTAELTQLVASGWAKPLTGSPEALRQAVPRVRAAPDEAELARDAAAMTARLPSLALRSARSALSGDASGARSDGARSGPAPGPVLVQVPRRGYLAAIACGRCRAQARCAKCGGPLQVAGSGEVPGCRWCGALAADWTCPRCGSDRLRAIVTGAARTAEELGRAFPGVPVRTSGGQHVLAAVPDEPALVIATPGAEPVAAKGYAAALLLDGWALLGRPSLRAAEETLRRWMNAAALVRPAGSVVVLAEATLPAVQALIRWDPVHFSERELAERTELGFPPAVRMAAITGSPDAVTEFVGSAALPPRAEVLGPVGGYGGTSSPPMSGGGLGGVVPPEESRALIRIPRPEGLALARALHTAQASRSARKDGAAVRVQLDPAEVA